MDDYTLARVLHILAIVPWIGGVAFVTTVLMPAIRRNTPPRERLAAFHRFEAGFAWQRGDTVAAERLQREAVQRLQSAANATDIAVARAQLAGYVALRGDKAQARQLLAQALPPMRVALLPQERSRANAEVLARKLGE